MVVGLFESSGVLGRLGLVAGVMSTPKHSYRSSPPSHDNSTTDDALLLESLHPLLTSLRTIIHRGWTSDEYLPDGFLVSDIHSTMLTITMPNNYIFIILYLPFSAHSLTHSLTIPTSPPPPPPPPPQTKPGSGVGPQLRFTGRTNRPSHPTETRPCTRITRITIAIAFWLAPCSFS